MRDFKIQLLGQIPHLRRYARALLGNLEGADDLVQDCLVRALSREQGYTQGTNLRAWLFTIMHNLFVDQMRSRARQPRRVPIEPTANQLSTSGGQVQRLELREFEAMLLRLPQQQRSVLLLVGLEGLSYEEAAEVVGTPVGTVKSRLSRARRALLEWTGRAENDGREDEPPRDHPPSGSERLFGRAP